MISTSALHDRGRKRGLFIVATRSPPVIGRRAFLIVTTSVSFGCTQNFPSTPTASVSTVLCLLPNQISVEEFLLDPAHGGGKLWGTAHNSVAGELGIGSQQELEDFVMDALPKFKLVTQYSNIVLYHS